MSVIKNAILGPTGLQLPTGCYGDTDLQTPSAGSLAVDAGKVKVRRLLSSNLYAIGTTIGSATFFWGMVRQAATLVDIQALVTGALFTSSDAVTVNLYKYATGSWSSVLSSVITLNASSTLLVAQSTTFSSTSLAAGTPLKLVTSVTGTSGVGLWAGVWLDENPSA